MTLDLSSDEYAIVEAAIRKMHGHMQQRGSVERALVRIVARFLSNGDAPRTLRYPLVVQMSPFKQERFCITERGIFSVSDPNIPLPAHSQDDNPDIGTHPHEKTSRKSTPPNQEKPPIDPMPVNLPQTQAPGSVINQSQSINKRKSEGLVKLLVLKRARWRCEQCGGRDGLQIVPREAHDHNASLDPESFQLMCLLCGPTEESEESQVAAPLVPAHCSED